jgi:hypothetical protein
MPPVSLMKIKLLKGVNLVGVAGDVVEVADEMAAILISGQKAERHVAPVVAAPKAEPVAAPAPVVEQPAADAPAVETQAPKASKGRKAAK